MTTYILTVLSLLILAVASVAWGSPVVPDPTLDPQGYADLIAALWAQARYAPLIAAVVVGIVAALRRWGAGVLPWVATRRGALVLVLASAASSSVAVGLLTGQAVPSIVVQALLAALMAVGGHAGGEAAVRGGAAPAREADAVLGSALR